MMSRVSRPLLALMLAGVVGCTGAAKTIDPVNSPKVQTLYRDEMAALKSDPRIQAAMDEIVALESTHMAELIELTEIPAPPFKEQQRGLRFAQMLKDAGLTDVSIDEVGNVIGRRPGTKGDRVIAYAAHLDTVFPEGTDVTVRTVGDKLYAPGIGDNSRGLILVLGVLRALQHANIETEADVLFIGNVGEEGLGDLRGVKHLFREGANKIDTFIAVDGGKPQRIIYGGVGSHRYRVTYSGPGGHSWGSFGRANPHHALGRAIALFDQQAAPITTEGDKSSYNIGLIGGGTSINSVPFESWAEVDIRSGDQAKVDAIDAVLQASVKQALDEENAGRSLGEELGVSVTRVGTRPAALGDTNWSVVQRLAAAIELNGLTPAFAISSTDANLPISKGIPSTTMSRGGKGGGAHAPGEWWQNVDGHVGIQIGLLLVVAEAGYVTDTLSER